MSTALQVVIQNQTGSDVFVQATGTGGSASIPLAQPLALSNLPLTGGLPSFTIDNLSAGRLYFSRGAVMPAGDLDPGNPNVASIRYDSVELTVDGTPFASANLTAVDQFALAMTLESLDSQGQVLHTLDYRKNAMEVIALLRTLAPKAVVPRDANQSFVRVLSPLKEPDLYPSFDNYVSTLDGQAIEIAGHFFGNPQSDYVYSGRIEHGGVTLTSADKSVNLVIAAADLNNTSIYRSNGAYMINGKAGSIDQNDVNAAVYRDVMTGLNLGYFSATDPTANNSANWGPLVPFASSNGNRYADIIYQASDSYGFPFADNKLKVLLKLDSNSVSALRITLRADEAHSG